jgi:hypothetical protein
METGLITAVVALLDLVTFVASVRDFFREKRYGLLTKAVDICLVCFRNTGTKPELTGYGAILADIFSSTSLCPSCIRSGPPPSADVRRNLTLLLHRTHSWRASTPG